MQLIRYQIFSIITVISLFLTMPGHTQNKTGQRLFYQIKLYHFSTSAQEASLDHYLTTAYLPALHRTGIGQVGVFKPIANDTATDKRIYVLIPLKTMEEILTLPQHLQKDAAYLHAAKPYLDAAYNNPPYTRLETILLQAFPLAPGLTPPAFKSAKRDRVYELRSYESATEALNVNKVHMFNEGGEIALFKRLGFNAVFYGEVLAGSTMPNLMYMTTFENMEAHDAHWKAFGNDPEWQTLSAKKEYQNNVSKHVIILTRPTDYSDY